MSVEQNNNSEFRGLGPVSSLTGSGHICRTRCTFPQIATYNPHESQFLDEEKRAADTAQSQGVCYQLEDLSSFPQAHMVGREK